MRGAKPVRLPGEGLLFCEEKEPKVTRGGPRDPRRVGTSRPETLRIPGAGLDDADKVPQAHINLVSVESKIKCAAGTLRAYPAAA